jgi:hypothetical protein
MPETREITVYTYAELSPQGRLAAQIRYNEPEDYWYEGITEGFTACGGERGFDIDDVQWSGFGSQGDGASWTGQVELVPFLAYHLKPDHPDYARYMVLIELIENGFVSRRLEVSRNSHMYNHDKTMFLERDSLVRAEDWRDTSVRSGIFAGADALPLAESIYAESLMDELLLWATEEARAYARDIYEALKTSHDEYSSEEYFAELCEINDWRFDASGKLVSE